jgi:hypothetical protein
MSSICPVSFANATTAFRIDSSPQANEEAGFALGEDAPVNREGRLK